MFDSTISSSTPIDSTETDFVTIKSPIANTLWSNPKILLIISKIINALLSLIDNSVFDKYPLTVISSLSSEIWSTLSDSFIDFNIEVSTLTIYSYLDALCKSFLIKRANRYDVKGKSVLKRLCKYYVTDLGIAQIKNHRNEISLNYALENVVYNELLVKGYNVYVGKIREGEIDFIGMKDNTTIYIQVAVTVQYEDTKDREFGAFKDITDNYPKYVISLDEGSFSIDGIKQVNIIDFLLDENF